MRGAKQLAVIAEGILSVVSVRSSGKRQVEKFTHDVDRKKNDLHQRREANGIHREVTRRCLAAFVGACYIQGSRHRRQAAGRPTR